MPRGHTGTGAKLEGRICAVCGGERFYCALSPEGLNGVRYVCRDCSNRRAREYRKRNPDRYRASFNRWFEKTNESRKRDRALLKYQVVMGLGGACACCREDDLRFLTIDHINRDGKEHRRQVKKVNYGVYKDIRRLGYPRDRFRVLCWNCHMAMSLNGSCPHLELVADAV